MPTIETLRENNIVQTTWNESLKSQELSQCFASLHRHIEEGEAVTHLLFDVQNAGIIPAQAPFLFIRSEIGKQSKLGRIAVIGSNPVAQILAQMAVKMLSINILFFGTEEEALAYLLD